MVTDIYLLVGAVLLVVSVLASKLSIRYGIPSLLLFLGIGMAIGSDGLNWIFFDDYQLAQSLGIVALAYILFSGGLDTNWKKIRPVLYPALSMATFGVLISAVVVGLFSVWLLNFSWIEGVLLGAIISSTDAAAVFSVLKSNGMAFKYRLKELIELESGTNDPMAIFLTIGLISVMGSEQSDWFDFFLLFITQMSFGLLSGFLFGKIFTWIVNKIDLVYEGLYPVLMIGLISFVYAITDMVNGSGFLAVYIVGVVMSSSGFVHQRSLTNFFDGIGWLMQIVMFLMLGLLVFPSQLIPVAGVSILIALALILVARPLSVFISLLFTKYNRRAKLMVSWIGLRGAVPIILATFPLVAGLNNADVVFSIVFFVVITSVLIQGTTIPVVAKWLHVNSLFFKQTRYPIQFEPDVDTKSALKEIVVEEDFKIVGQKIVDLHLPDNVLIVLINREGKFIVPKGTTVIQPEDKLLLLASKTELDNAKKILKQIKPKE
ncbi:potassium/proton antiporter [Rhodohalobacter halophilus]|uniref:potassium/proton antiporter n=1 Tax=Rhodohalobacter halophilus TaxID=1812810 RepID=UPI00083FAA22|nr:potassium/proton antiporter [Rhodohalobacter halophilus]